MSIMRQKLLKSSVLRELQLQQDTEIVKSLIVLKAANASLGSTI